MQFLPDAFVKCGACDGRRFRPEVLEVHCRGLSIADALDLPAVEVARVFGDRPAVVTAIRPLVDLGLGYLSLSQPAPTLSGGEAQRLKLARALAESGETKGRLYLLDEPTTGLHPADVAVLAAALQQLVDAGHSVVVVEHDMGFAAAADWVIDLGPEAGDEGGRVVGEGTPEAIAARATPTGRAMAKALGKGADTATSVVRMPTAARRAKADANGRVIRVVGAREHNLQARRRRDPARQARRGHRRLRLRQVDARVRRALRRGPAPLPRLPLDLRPPVHPAAGAARGGPARGRAADRRPRAEALARDAALDRRHVVGGLPPPATAVVAPRLGALPEVRSARTGGRRRGPRRARGRGLPARRSERPRPARPPPQGLPPRRDRRGAPQGLRRGAHRRENVRGRGPAPRRPVPDPRRRGARRAGGDEPRPAREARAGHRPRAVAQRRDAARDRARRRRALLLHPALVPELRHRLPRARPAPLLVEPEVRRLPGVRGLRGAARRGGRRDAPGTRPRLPGLRRDAPAARGARREDRRPPHRRDLGPDRPRDPRVARDAPGRPARGGARARLAGAGAAARPPRPPRPRLPHARARGRHALDRRGPAHPHRRRARVEPARRLLRARRADSGPPPARRRGSDEGAPRPARPRQHGRRRGARGERHPRRRPRHRPRPRRRAERRPARRHGLARGDREEQGVGHGPLPARRRRRATVAAPRPRRRRPAAGQRRAAAQPAQRRRPVRARPPDRGHRRLRLRQVDARPRRAVPRRPRARRPASGCRRCSTSSRG